MTRGRFAACVLACVLAAAQEISRPARTWEFLDATGPRSSLLGQENGTLEGYIYPLKIFKDLRLQFVSAGQTFPAETLARRITSRPGSYTITYTGDDFRVTETLVAPIDQPGALILLDVSTRSPLRIDVEFTRDFQLMWPAAIGSGYTEWNEPDKAFLFGADGHPFAAVLGSPHAALVSREHATDYSQSTGSRFTLGVINGHAERVVALAGSVKSRDEALTAYRQILSHPRQIVDDTERHYRDYLAHTVELQLPDERLQRAYDWSRISMVKGFVDNPFLGRGLVAGYGPSKGGYRPGYSWFFGRDTFWSSLALTAAGDFAGARTAIAFISKYQRDDGKLPHEISQATSFVDWFKQFPYGYASADATPLYAIAVRDYIQASGDVGFAREQAPRLWKSLDFMRSTLDEAGFPKNQGVGHGWVEGGRLLPIRTELYQAGCYVEALRALAYLARAIGDNPRAAALEAEFERKRRALNDLYWLPQSHVYAFAVGNDGKPVDQPSVLATVPMWFDLLDRRQAREMIGQLAAEDHAADWGMRIISSKNPLYDPSGYHYGSIWPLFTGWASVGEYRNHAAEPALANLRANAWLTLDGAGGNPTEVLSGEAYASLSTASPHQIWSAAMVVSPLLKGLLGLEIDAIQKRIRFAPHLPADWKNVAVHGVAGMNFDLRRDADALELKIANSGAQSFEVDFAPAYPPCARIAAATLDGKTVTWKDQAEDADFHPHFIISVKPGSSTLRIRHSGFFGYVVPFTPPHLAEPSANLKVLSEHWTNNGESLDLTVSGLAGRDYRIGLIGAKQGDSVVVHMPGASSPGYVTQHLTITPH